MADGLVVGVAAPHIRFISMRESLVGPEHSYQPWETRGTCPLLRPALSPSLYSGCESSVTIESTHMHYPPHSGAARLWDQLSRTPRAEVQVCPPLLSPPEPQDDAGDADMPEKLGCV